MHQRLTLTVEQAARWLGIHVSTAHELIVTGRLLAVRVGGRTYVRRGAIDALRTHSPSEAA